MSRALMSVLMLGLMTVVGVAAPSQWVSVRVSADASLRGGDILVRADGGPWQTRGLVAGDSDILRLAAHHNYDVRIEKPGLWSVRWGFSGVSGGELASDAAVHIHEEEKRLPNWRNIVLAAATVGILLLGSLWLWVRLRGSKDPTAELETTLSKFGFRTRLRSKRGVRLPGSGIIGPYRIGALVGEGGNAAVYQVTDAEGSSHAMKIPHALACQEPDFVKRFKREIAICMTLQHPNIVRAYDSGSYDPGNGTEIPYLVMEIAPGTPLDGYLTGQMMYRSVPDIPLVVRMSRGVAAALAAAHAVGVVHRDVKPSNIMVDEEGNVKVMDFGIARAHTQFTALTQGAVGTPTYMAPEQISNYQDVDHRADFYALGTVMFRLLTHTLPFDENDMVATVQQKLSQSAPPVRERNARISPVLGAVVDRLLQRNPADRYQSAAELIAALDRCG